MINSRFLPCLLLAFLWFAPQMAKAHAPDQSYLYLSIYKDAIEGRVEMTAKDMNRALNLGLPDRLTLSDIMPVLGRLQNYLGNRVALAAQGGPQSYRIVWKDPTVLNLDEMEDFVRFHFSLEGVGEVPEVLDINYNVLFDNYDKHRGVLIIEHNWKAGILENESRFAHIFSPSDTEESLSLADNSVWKGFWALLKLGVWHIWIGLDHILFIIALILPAVVRRKPLEATGSASAKSWRWEPVTDFKSAFLYIIKIVTFFTIAHSITLALASLGIVDLPSRWVESIIAFSIGLAALHNITPIFKSKEWIIAFGFGLFHGFGFASVLGEKGLSGDFMAYSLLGFNLGVEIGQLFIICMAFPVLFFIRKQRWYPKFITYGSILLILIALHWTIERGFEIDIQIVGTLRRMFNL